jgi:hypothetical protein
VPSPDFSQFQVVHGAAEGSNLRRVSGLREVVGFLSTERFIGYMESTLPGSEIALRLPVPMACRFLDAGTGVVLQELAVPAVTAGESPPRVHPPSGYAAVFLDLQANRASFARQAPAR